MEQKLQLLVLIALICSLVLLSVPSASAVAIGVNKADIIFDEVLRNGYAETTFVVSTDTQDLITGMVEVEGDVADWLRFEPEGATTTGFNFSANSPARIKVIAEPPIDAANGDYEGMIRVITGELMFTTDGQFGTSTRAAFKLDALVGVTDVEVNRCRIGGVQLGNTEVQQPIDFSYSVTNNGNVRERPELLVKVFNQYQDRVVREVIVETTEDTLPTTSQEFFSQIEHELDVGQYWASVTSEDCEGGGFVTFDVLERGGIADDGEFVRIDKPVWANVGDVVPITAIFRNTGSRTVSAKFKGTIMLGRKLVKVIDTDFYDTPPGGTAEIETFFNPDAAGQYEIKGRILYNNKLTFERMSILNVNGPGTKLVLDIGATFGPPFLLIVIIVLLLLLIKRRRRRRRSFGF